MTDRAPHNSRLVEHASQRDQSETSRTSATSVASASNGPEFLQQAVGNGAVSDFFSKNGGAALPPTLRWEMEQRFGSSFADVRIHDNPRSAVLAKGLSAKAFTFGTDIAFAHGRFEPGTYDGKKLITHELAHVIQQNRGGTETPTVNGTGSLESSAERAAETSSQGGGTISVGAGSAPGIAAQPEEPSLWSRGRNWVRSKFNAAEAQAGALREKLSTGYESGKEAVVNTFSRIDTPENRAYAVGILKDIANPSVPIASQTEKWEQSTKQQAEATGGDKDTKQLAVSRANVAHAVNRFAQAWKAAQTEPGKAAQEAWGRQTDAKNGPLTKWQRFKGAASAAQDSADKGAQGMTDAFKEAVNDWEDGKFEPAPTIDPEKHPTLSAVSEAAEKGERQVIGGGAKALWSMAAGISMAVRHPLRTAEGLGEMPGSTLGPNPLAVGAQALKSIDDYVSTDKTAKQVLVDFAQKQRPDPSRDFRKSVDLVKGLGEGYIESAGYKIDESKESRPIVKGGKARWGEIFGRLIVDVGSMLTGGGEANAASKEARVLGGLSREVAGTSKIADEASLATKLSQTDVALEAARGTEAAPVLDAATPNIEATASENKLGQVDLGPSTPGTIELDTAPRNVEATASESTFGQVDLGPSTPRTIELDRGPRPASWSNYNEIDLGPAPSGPGPKLYRGEKPVGSIPGVRKTKPTFGPASTEKGGTLSRTGMHFHEYNEAELSHGLRIDYDPIAGRTRSVSVRVDGSAPTGPQVAERQFAQDPSVAGAQSTNAAYVDSGYDRGHLVPREALKGSEKAEKAADLFTNVTPMKPELNRGPGSPWRASENKTMQWAKEHGSVDLRVEPIFDADPPRLPDGTPIPKAIRRSVMAPDGTVLEDVSFLNK